MEFTKMHGCGNDYIYIDGARFPMAETDKPEFVRRYSDRHKGIGGDGVIFINPSDIADFEMEMWNADGTRAEMCGNGIRCVAKYVFDHSLTDKTRLNIISGGSIKEITGTVENGVMTRVRVNMGEPVLIPAEIPVDIPGQTDKPIIDVHIPVQKETQDLEYPVTCVSMGNPHAVIFVDNVWDYDIANIGPMIESHKYFPKRINTEFVHVCDRSHIDMRVWERGTGETLACGTGACASVVACILNGYCDEDVEVRLLGGNLSISWSGPGHHVYMTGPAEEVYSGEIRF